MRTRLFLMLPLICAPLAFWACGGDSGTSAKDDESSSSSSSVILSSSSSVIPSSSSSVIPGHDRESSSSVAKSSSSVASIAYGELLDTRDNQVYKTVTIGSQIWMAQNLNYAYNEPTSRLDSSSFCYNNSADSCAKNGRLYLWSAAMDSAAVFSTAGKGCGDRTTCRPSGTVRGVCPEGWHLPNYDEWDTLVSTVGGKLTAGRRLKSFSGWNLAGSGADSFGFRVLPAGYRDYDGGFYAAGYNASFWSSTEDDSDDANSRRFSCGYDGVYCEYYGKDIGRSVRCLKD